MNTVVTSTLVSSILRSNKIGNNARYEVLVGVFMKITIFQDAIDCYDTSEGPLASICKEELEYGGSTE
jgi:hypothetical protein